MALPWLASCSGLLPRSTPSPSTAPSDPTPLAKCRVAANAQSPLVTEWPASEKAHLESLTESQTVAVAYSGCELRIVEACSLPGRYGWRHTTLATDQVEISNADELYAKLPIGAVALEGELARSGRLAVKTTVSGQLVSEWKGASAPRTPACAGATHYISAISVGAFQLVSGSDASGSGKVGVAGLGGNARANRSESVLREAGSRAACDQATDEAMSRQCGSPIQVFLAPIGPVTSDGSARNTDDQMRATGVDIHFPAPRDEGEVWTVRAADGRLVCQVPCEAWVGPVSGYYLQREARNGADQAVLHLPQSFPHRVGSSVTAEYQVERGSPQLAKWAFYGSLPVAAMGTGLGIWGVVQATSSCDSNTGGCFPPAGFLFTASAFFLAGAGAATWWYLHSREEKFVTYENLPKSSRSEPSLHVMFGPGVVTGTF
jgi:hypothetical protein